MDSVQRAAERLAACKVKHLLETLVDHVDHMWPLCWNGIQGAARQFTGAAAIFQENLWLYNSVRASHYW